MTDQEINVAIAELCGWQWWHFPDATESFYTIAAPGRDWPTKRFNGVKCDRPTHSWMEYASSVPNYCGDLNAMHGVEKTLLHADDYEKHLEMVWRRDERIKDLPASHSYHWHASARQRAEAFLRVHGKWKE